MNIQLISVLRKQNSNVVSSLRENQLYRRIIPLIERSNSQGTKQERQNYEHTLSYPKRYFVKTVFGLQMEFRTSDVYSTVVLDNKPFLTS